MTTPKPTVMTSPTDGLVACGFNEHSLAHRASGRGRPPHYAPQRRTVHWPKPNCFAPIGYPPQHVRPHVPSRGHRHRISAFPTPLPVAAKSTIAQRTYTKHSTLCSLNAEGLNLFGPTKEVQFTAEALQAWLKKVGAKPIQIYPGSLWENGYNERFNRRLRREVLNPVWFATRPLQALGMHPSVTSLKLYEKMAYMIRAGQRHISCWMILASKAENAVGIRRA